MNMEDILLRLPDKIVADDVKNYLDKTKTHHLFSDIYKGRTSLYPHPMIQYLSNADRIVLYGGGWGMGNYLEVHYSTKTNKYMYYQTGGSVDEKTQVHFECDNWTEFYTYVRKNLLDTFIWFNLPKNEKSNSI